MKRLLWKRFDKYFKEYLFLSQIGIDRALINRLFMRFLSEFQNKSAQAELIAAIGGEVELEIGSQGLVLEVEILRTTNKLGLTTTKLGLNNSSSGRTDFSLAITSRNFSGKKHEKNASKNVLLFPLLDHDYNLTDIHKIYPNYLLSRSKDSVKLTFWR